MIWLTATRMGLFGFRNVMLTGVFASLIWLFLHAPARSDIGGVAYGPDPSQRLDICDPSGQSSHPAVVMIHGGGLISGDKRGYDWLCHQAALRGIVAVKINYRLATGPVDRRWPAQLNDVRAAIAWVKEHAGSLHIDPAKICLLGDSSGAQLALDVALGKEDERPACVVDQYGPVDLTAWGPGGDLLGPVGRDAVARLRREMSPLFLVDATAPPVLILHGTDDQIVPFKQSEDLRDALQAAGDRVLLTAFHGGHSYSGLTDQERGKLMTMGLEFVLQTTESRKSVP